MKLDMIKIYFNKQVGGKIPLRKKTGGFYINMGEITHITCDGYVITIHLINKETHCLTGSLKYFENDLKKYGFFRANRNILINVVYIIDFQLTHKEKNVNLHGINIHVSRRKVAQLKKILYG